MKLYTIQTRFAILKGKSFSVVALIFAFNYALDSLLYIKHLENIMKPETSPIAGIMQLIRISGSTVYK